VPIFVDQGRIGECVTSEYQAPGNLAPLREQYLREATAARDCNPRQRRDIVRIIIGENLALRAVTEAAVFAAAYDNPAEYWDAWTCEPLSVVEFIQLLSIHIACEDGLAPELLQDIQFELKERLSGAFRIGEPWFVVDPLEDPESPRPKLLVKPRPAALWLLSNPIARHLVCHSLVQYLAANAPMPGSPAALRPRRQKRPATEKRYQEIREFHKRPSREGAIQPGMSRSGQYHAMTKDPQSRDGKGEPKFSLRTFFRAMEDIAADE
jgi:hypothetical protein